MKSKTSVSNAVLTANQITDVRDIKNNVLYTKSNYVIKYLRLYPINIDLLSESEKESLCNTLTASFKSMEDPFTIISIPRTVDMEDYINYLTSNYDDEIENPERKSLLNIMIKEASEKVMSGNNFEHQFYIKAWEKEHGGEETKKLKERIEEISNNYNMVQNPTKVVEDIEIIKLCNLYGNSNTAVMENYNDYDSIPIPFINERSKSNG